MFSCGNKLFVLGYFETTYFFLMIEVVLLRFQLGIINDDNTSNEVE
jgi:hypothetical protein